MIQKSNTKFLFAFVLQSNGSSTLNDYVKYLEGHQTLDKNVWGPQQTDNSYLKKFSNELVPNVIQRLEKDKAFSYFQINSEWLNKKLKGISFFQYGSSAIKKRFPIEIDLASDNVELFLTEKGEGLLSIACFSPDYKNLAACQGYANSKPTNTIELFLEFHYRISQMNWRGEDWFKGSNDLQHKSSQSGDLVQLKKDQNQTITEISIPFLTQFLRELIPTPSNLDLSLFPMQEDLLAYSGVQIPDMFPTNNQEKLTAINLFLNKAANVEEFNHPNAPFFRDVSSYGFSEYQSAQITRLGCVHVFGDDGTPFANQKMERVMTRHFFLFFLTLFQRMRLNQLLSRLHEILEDPGYQNAYLADSQSNFYKKISKIRKDFQFFNFRFFFSELSQRSSIEGFYQKIQSEWKIPETLQSLGTQITDLDVLSNSEKQLEFLEHQKKTEFNLEILEVMIFAYYIAALYHYIHPANPSDSWHLDILIVGAIGMVLAAVILFKPKIFKKIKGLFSKK